VAQVNAGKQRKPAPDRPKRLLVEGSDDKWSIIALIMRHGLNFENSSMPNVNPVGDASESGDAGGVSRLLSTISSAAKNYPHLGIVLDADLDLPARWRAVGDRLREVGIEVPDELPPQGLIVRGSLADYRLGVWIMPDNRSSGMLEDFLSRLVPEGDRTWALACESTERARMLGAPLSPLHRSKGELHTWLAWREQPGKPFGTALTAHYLQSDTLEARAFLAWFRELFEV
jgi:hypothetical protein